MELAGQTVVIVGCGSVGTECAKRFKAFDCRVLGVDVFVRTDPHFDGILPIEELDSVLIEADIVVLTVPLTEKTWRLIDARRLSQFHGVLVNISRGAVVDESALAEWDGMAVLDVFEEEPLNEKCELWGKENYCITPHNSFVGNENGMRLATVIIDNLHLLKG